MKLFFTAVLDFSYVTLHLFQENPDVSFKYPDISFKIVLNSDDS